MITSIIDWAKIAREHNIVTKFTPDKKDSYIGQECFITATRPGMYDINDIGIIVAVETDGSSVSGLAVDKSGKRFTIPPNQVGLLSEIKPELINNYLDTLREEISNKTKIIDLCKKLKIPYQENLANKIKKANNIIDLLPETKIDDKEKAIEKILTIL